MVMELSNKGGIMDISDHKQEMTPLTEQELDEARLDIARGWAEHPKIRNFVTLSRRLLVTLDVERVARLAAEIQRDLNETHGRQLKHEKGVLLKEVQSLRAELAQARKALGVIPAWPPESGVVSREERGWKP